MKRLMIGVLFLMLSSSCTRYYWWGACHFVSAEERNNSLVIEAQKDAVSRPIRHQLQTIDIVYALWVSDVVQRAHAILMKCPGAPEVSETSSPQVQSIFYVVMDQEKKAWNFALEVGDQKYEARSVKGIDLDRAYKYLMGPSVERFKKNAYEVRFDRLVDRSESFALCVSNEKYAVKLCWQAA